MPFDDQNSMQTNLGLSTSPTGFNPVGIPTPMVRHPGEVAASLVQQAQTQAYQTMTAGGMRPLASSGLSPGDAASQMYAQQFQQNMAQLNNQMFSNPFYAQAASRMGGGPGFVPGMMPSAMQFTDPSMGIFRPFPQGPGSSIPPVPMLPLIRTPLTPTPPAPRFQTPFEYNYAYQQMQADQLSSAGLAAPGVLARAGVTWGAAHIGSGIGAALGGIVGGAPGAAVGFALGRMGGGALSELGGFGSAAQHIVNNINPATTMAYRAAQMQGMSGDWVVGGPGLAQTGTGWSRSASIHAGRMIEDLAYSGPFRNETQRNFSVQDMTRITREAGRQGMLDFAQTPEAMRDEVKKIATHLKLFMQIANEPDVREAIKQMGRLRTMGLNVGEATGVAFDSKMFARMAGTTMHGLMETAGLPGALMAQQMGLSAGAGLHIGQGMYGLARQAVAGGAYSTQDLAMLGGVQGIAQRNTEAALATLKMPMLTSAMAGISSGGKWGLSQGNIQALLSGKLSIEDLARMGAGNIQGAVAQHGLGALGSYMMDESKLQDDMAKQLGPIGMKQLQQRNILALQKNYSLDQSEGGLGMAAMMSGMTSDQAKQFVREARSPMSAVGVRQQLEVQRRELRALAGEQNEARRGGLYNRLSRTEGGLLYGFDEGADQLATRFRSGLEHTGRFFAEMAEDAMLPTGVEMLRTPDHLQITSDLEYAKIQEAMKQKRVNPAYSGGHTASPFRGNTSLASEGYYNFQNQYLGGDTAAVSELKRRRGGMAAYLPTALYRFTTGLSGEQVMAQNAAYENVGVSVRAGMTASAEDLAADAKASAAAYGMSPEVFAANMRTSQKILAETANRNYGSGLAKPKALNEMDQRLALMKGFKDIPGLSNDQYRQMLDDPRMRRQMSSALPYLTAAQGQDVVDETVRHSTGALLSHEEGIKAATDRQDKYVRDLFGGDYVNDKGREALKSFALLPPEVAAYVAIQSAVSLNKEGGIEQMQGLNKTLGDDKFLATANLGKSYLRLHQGNEKLYSGNWDITGKMSPDKLISALQGVSTSYHQDLGTLRTEGGLVKWNVDAPTRETLSKMFSGEIDEQSGRALLKGSSAAQSVPQIKEWLASKETVGDLRDSALAAGGTGADTEVGRDYHTLEAQVDAKIQGSADIQRALGKSFPNAVKELSTAALRLQSLADVLGMKNGATVYSGPDPLGH